MVGRAVRGVNTDGCDGCGGGCGPELRGAICPSGTGPGGPSTSGFVRREANGTRAKLLEHAQARDGPEGPDGVDRLRRLHGQPGPPTPGRHPQEGAADGDGPEGPANSPLRPSPRSASALRCRPRGDSGLTPGSRATAATVLPEESTSAIASRMNSSVDRFVVPASRPAPLPPELQDPELQASTNRGGAFTRAYAPGTGPVEARITSSGSKRSSPVGTSRLLTSSRMLRPTSSARRSVGCRTVVRGGSRNSVIIVPS